MSDLLKLAEDVARRGVQHVFGIPGSGASLTLLDALEKQGVSFYLTHFEGTAALIAGAIGKLSGRAGVAVSIKGPGLANMVSGLAACKLESLPIVSLSEAYAPETPSSKAHKRMDHEGLISAVSKGRRFLSKHGPGFKDMANWSEAEMPGPVHLEIAEKGIKQDSPIERDDEPGKEDSDRISDLILSAERPLVIAGTLAFREGLSPMLNRLSIPAFSVAAAKGVIDETLPHAAGVYTGVGLELTPEYSILSQADLILGIGLRHNEVLNVKSFGCKSANIDPLGSSFCDGFKFDYILKGKKENWMAIFSALEEKAWGLDQLQECLRRLRDEKLSTSFLPAKAFHVIEKHFNHHCRFVLDTGNFCTIGEHIWRVPKPEWYLAAGQGRYMGTGLPLALGGSLYDQDVPTAVFLGDGGVGMYIADLKIAVEQRLPLIVVLMSDAHLGSIWSRSIRDGLTEKPVTIHQPSWLKAVKGLGVDGERCESEFDLNEILKAWDSSSGPLFIEIPFDPEAYQQMTEGIR